MAFTEFPGLFSINKFVRQGKTVSELTCEVWNDVLTYAKTGTVSTLLEDFTEHHSLTGLPGYKPTQIEEPCFVVPGRAALIVYSPETDDMLAGTFETDSTGKRTFVRSSTTDTIGSAKADANGGKQISALGTTQGLTTIMQILDLILLQFHITFGAFTEIKHYGAMREAIQTYSGCTCLFIFQLSRFASALSYLNGKVPSIAGLHYGSEPATLGSIIERGVNLGMREEYFKLKFVPTEAVISSKFYTVRTSASGGTIISTMTNEFGLIYSLPKAGSVRVPVKRAGRLGEIADFGDDAA